ncbi:ABC transporter ATP-binding protein [Planctobacterium marinum]|uniref:ABC transporter ATP-binding protein n=1 Tax=Planctobacterium marinum TaxID=1631968 RepID=UPI001E37D4D1|nr:ABC transporter ATP-binding protein [Planctobacterium marinum]MCC2605782.1 ABC transporter ATP-binding protein [Planctobacterium marinum]
MAVMIEVRQLSKAFNGLKAVDNVSFSVEKGKCFGLLGPNGAGKSTTIEMMEGIAKPDSGEILFEGSPLSRESLKRIGIQFQNTALQDYLTTLETIRLFRSFYEQGLAEQEIIELCQLQDFLNQDHRKLSGGQRQRLLLGLALVNDPDILFLDEPTTGLDPHARRNFWELIRKIKGQGKTVVLTTHYMDEAEFLCDHIELMDKGKIIEKGHPGRLLNKHFSGALIRIPMQPLTNEVIGALAPEQNHDFWDINTHDVQQTLAQLVQAQVSLEGLHVKSANLDDLFLKLTGQQLGD